MEPPRGKPVEVTLNATAAEMLARLAVELGGGDPSAVVLRALGLFELAQRGRRQGARLVMINARGEQSDVAF